MKLYQTKVKLNATRGNQFHGERQRMTPEAAAEINAYRGALRLMERAAQAPSDAERQEMLRIRGKIGALLQAPKSWRSHALYSYETNASQRTNGLSYVFAAQSVKQISAQRELSALPARV
ncbi:hypothetical protein [Robbsia sp. KACC 23696]|uniref:hypothetical protein n=1 Tax=Robbsia sp. KACC 23696 TaxID=3149231 RepID=UPI00325C1DDB